MDNQEYKEKIKKIIKRGYDLKLISVELKMPIEELEMYKNEIEKESQESGHSSMLTLKENYYKLYSKKKENNNFANKTKTLTKQEKVKLEKIFKEIEKELRSINPC